jgi:alkanesulfonate monooxygenase SsuD/methylene tetrahydromethanopterin reductase-like flavin-dependent oxidoreductase (luciferase family)
MRFSIFLSHTRLGSPEDYDVDLYKEKLDEAIESDKLGYYCIWVPEHHLIHKIQIPNGLLSCVHIGNHVGCRVGQAVNLITYRHPLITAGEIAAADNMLNGRLSVGVGRGAYQYEFERLGIPFSESKERFEEALSVLVKIWESADRGVIHNGKYWSFEQTYVWPRPVQKPGPELWYGAQSNPSVEDAARRGFHVSNWPLLHPMSVVAETAAIFRRGREYAGRSRGEQKFAILRGAYVAETREKARRGLEAALVNHRINRGLHHFTQEADERGVVFPHPVNDEPGLDQMYDNLIVGTPQECLEKIEEYDHLGVDELILWFDYQKHQVAMDSMRLFSEEVMRPYLRCQESPLATADHAARRSPAAHR